MSDQERIEVKSLLQPVLSYMEKNLSRVSWHRESTIPLCGAGKQLSR